MMGICHCSCSNIIKTNFLSATGVEDTDMQDGVTIKDFDF